MNMPPPVQGVSPPQAPAQMQTQAQRASPQQSPTPEAQQQPPQPQPQEKMFLHCNGAAISQSALLTSFDRARAFEQKGGKIAPDTVHEMKWMLQQHYPQHPYLRGQFFPPPPKTKKEVMVELNKRGGLGPMFEIYRMQMQRKAELLAAQNAGQQQQSGQLMGPNARSTNIIPANMRQAAGGQAATTPPKWPNWTPSMTPNINPTLDGQLFQRRQPLGGLAVDPATGAVPVNMSQQLGPQSARQGPGSPSQAPSQQQFSAQNVQTLRPPSAGPYSQNVRSPSHPSPFKTHPASIELPLAPNFCPPSAPIPSPPQASNVNNTVPQPRRDSTPALGMFAPPLTLSHSPSFQSETAHRPPLTPAEQEARKQSKRAQGNSFLASINMSRADITQLSPKKQQKLQQKFEEWAVRARHSDLKRKASGLGMEGGGGRPLKQQVLVADLPAHRANQLRRQNEEVNCGFGPKTMVIRSNPSSRAVSPLPPAARYVPQQHTIPETYEEEMVLPPHFDVPEEQLFEYVQVHGVCMADLDLTAPSTVRTELAQLGALGADIRAFLAAFDVGKYVGRNQGFVDEPRDPRVLAALERVRREKEESGVTDTDNDGRKDVDDDDDVDVGEWVRSNMFTGVDMSEEKVGIEWGMMNVSVQA